MTRLPSTTGARSPLTLRMLCAAGVLLPAAALADNAAPAAPTSTENLARLMLEKKVITPEQADSIITQAREEASRATAATKPDDAVRVRYVPETVKAQLREDVKQEVMDRARRENWAQPEAVPEWTKRFRFHGDIRVRAESLMYPSGNDTSGAFPDFNAINRGDPYDVSPSNPNFAPQRNVDQDRNRIRMRLRFGADIDLGEDFTAGLRFATGNNSSPVSANQTFGEDGGFSKYSLWVDRAFIKYQPLRGDTALDLTIGRFDNPFVCTPMMWDEDLGFDGFALTVNRKVSDRFSAFFTTGVFPVFNTDMDFAINRTKKFKSEDKWLYAAQLGVEVKPVKDLTLSLAAAYYMFDNVQGKLSTPYIPLGAQDAGDTDGSRPAFAQSGNTYMPIRDIVPDASNGFGTTNQFQYFGLAAPFRIGSLTARADYAGFDPVHLSLVGEVVKNFAFEESAMAAHAVNNRSGGEFKGGDMGYDLTLNIGAPALEKRWDWIVGIGYRYLESDAVLDGFTDSDLGGGGTNLKGYTLSGSLAVSKSVSLRARWFSAESVSGPKYSADTVMFDVTARF